MAVFGSPESIISLTLRVGVVYKINAPELITTNVPHYFVVVAINNGDNYLLLSTKKVFVQASYIKKKGHDPNTLAHLLATSSNGLTEDSYFNCNDYYIITKEQLIKKVAANKLKLTGNLSEEEYNKLVKSMGLSEVLDIPKKLLKYS